VAMPDGQLFHTITYGVRNMPSYGKQIPEEDRWAIVAYLRALQRSNHATINDVPESERANLK
jgi:mono/diheme cytochrome c family protein